MQLFLDEHHFTLFSQFCLIGRMKPILPILEHWVEQASLFFQCIPKTSVSFLIKYMDDVHSGGRSIQNYLFIGQCAFILLKWSS